MLQSSLCSLIHSLSSWQLSFSLWLEESEEENRSTWQFPEFNLFINFLFIYLSTFFLLVHLSVGSESIWNVSVCSSASWFVIALIVYCFFYRSGLKRNRYFIELKRLVNKILNHWLMSWFWVWTTLLMLLQCCFGCDSCGSPVIAKHSSLQQHCGSLLILRLPCIWTWKEKNEWAYCWLGKVYIIYTTNSRRYLVTGVTISSIHGVAYVN